jgi:hypothetical protein
MFYTHLDSGNIFDVCRDLNVVVSLVLEKSRRHNFLPERLANWRLGVRLHVEDAENSSRQK